MKPETATSVFTVICTQYCSYWTGKDHKGMTRLVDLVDYALLYYIILKQSPAQSYIPLEQTI